MQLSAGAPGRTLAHSGKIFRNVRPRYVCAAGTSSEGQVIKPQGQRKGRNVVVAVDDDQMSWEAVKFTVTELYREGDVLHLLHVIPRDSVNIPIPHSAMASMSYTESIDFESALLDHAMQFIRTTMVGFAEDHKAKCEVDIIRGVSRESIGRAICNTADELEASLIVVPGWRSPGVFDQIFQQDRVMFGSYVAKHATRPCLVYQSSA